MSTIKSKHCKSYGSPCMSYIHSRLKKERKYQETKSKESEVVCYTLSKEEIENRYGK